MRKVIHIRGKTISLVNKHVSKHNQHRLKPSSGGTLLLKSINKPNSIIKSSSKLVQSKGGAIFNSKPIEKPIHKIIGGKTSKPIRLAL